MSEPIEPSEKPAVRFDLSGCLAERSGGGGIAAAELEALLERHGELPERVRREHEGEGRHAHLDMERVTEDAREALGFATEARFRFHRMVQCGIGGSAMGNRAAHAALAGDREVAIVDNVDPARLAGLEGDELRGTLFHIVTKSGETAETLAQLAIVRERLEAVVGERWVENVCVTTDPDKGTLRALCRELRIQAFPLAPRLGGRFSYLSPVGFVSLAFAGRDPLALVGGALAARDRGLEPRSAALSYAALITRFYEAGRPTAVFWPYADGLWELGRWWQQLLAESLGKRKAADGREVHAGPLPYPALGATDQHSVHQLFMEGPADKWFTFLEVEDMPGDVEIPKAFADRPAFAYLGGVRLGDLLRAERKGTMHALLEAGRPCCLVRVPALDEARFGELLTTLMLAVTYAGAMLGVDPYDQPGVEAGKRATFALLGRDGYPGGAAIEAALEPEPRWVL